MQKSVNSCLQNSLFQIFFSRFLRLSNMNKDIEVAPKGKYAQLTLGGSFQDKLLFILCNAHKLEEKPKQLEGELFDRLFEIARISNFNTEELAEYEANRMNMLDYNASMKFARKEGIALGRDEGILQTARKMKAKGLNFALIAEITGLSEAEIEATP